MKKKIMYCVFTAYNEPIISSGTIGYDEKGAKRNVEYFVGETWKTLNEEKGWTIRKVEVIINPT